MTDYRSDNIQHKPEAVKQKMLDWALRSVTGVADTLDGENEPVEQQLQADLREGAIAIEKSVASAALLLRSTTHSPARKHGANLDFPWRDR
eukprot:5749405-Amphidinium_carterae.1